MDQIFKISTIVETLVTLDEGDQNDDQWEWYSDDEEDQDTTAKLEEDKLDEGTFDVIYTCIYFFHQKTVYGAIHKLCESWEGVANR